MKKKINKIVGTLLCIVCFIVLLSESVIAKGENMDISSMTISDGEQEYGVLYGAPYSDTDDSEWLTLKLGGRGLRIVNDENTDIILIDQFGSVYINGQLCNFNQADSSTDINTNFSYGFMYFLIIVALLLSGYNFIARKKS